MISKPVHEIRFADLNALIGTVAEGKTIEYKREMPAGTRDEKIKFLAAVASLANTAGGDSHHRHRRQRRRSGCNTRYRRVELGR